MANAFAPTPGAGRLFDEIMEVHAIKNDAALSRELGVAPPVISKQRNGSLTVGPSMILAIHEKFNVPVAWIREWLA